MLKKFPHLLTIYTCFIAINIADAGTHAICAELCSEMHQRCVTDPNHCYIYLQDNGTGGDAATSCRTFVESEDFDESSLEMLKGACSLGCDTASTSKLCDGPCPPADLILFHKLKEKNP